MKARFASQIQNLIVGVRSERPATDALDHDGRPVRIPAVPALDAVFSHALMTPADAVEAKARMNFIGTVEDEGGRPIDPTYRISVFDLETAALQNGWSEDEARLVVERLREGVGNDFIELTPVVASKPWNGYDNESEPERIVELALAIDADLSLVAIYEQENQNRPDVLEAISDALAAGEETTIVHA
jgi:hypothetical protein